MCQRGGPSHPPAAAAAHPLEAPDVAASSPPGSPRRCCQLTRWKPPPPAAAASSPAGSPRRCWQPPPRAAAGSWWPHPLRGQLQAWRAGGQAGRASGRQGVGGSGPGGTRGAQARGVRHQGLGWRGGYLGDGTLLGHLERVGVDGGQWGSGVQLTGRAEADSQLSGESHTRCTSWKAKARAQRRQACPRQGAHQCPAPSSPCAR